MKIIIPGKCIIAVHRLLYVLHHFISSSGKCGVVHLHIGECGIRSVRMKRHFSAFIEN